jgi:hypothetical protein
LSQQQLQRGSFFSVRWYPGLFFHSLFVSLGVAQPYSQSWLYFVSLEYKIIGTFGMNYCSIKLICKISNLSSFLLCYFLPSKSKKFSCTKKKKTNFIETLLYLERCSMWQRHSLTRIIILWLYAKIISILFGDESHVRFIKFWRNKYTIINNLKNFRMDVPLLVATDSAGLGT